MATLLCSMLIGAGFPAIVVSGAARRQTVENNQQEVEFPVPEDVDYESEMMEEADEIPTSDKYLLKSKPILESRLKEVLQKREEEKARKRLQDEKEALANAREVREEAMYFESPYRLTHAWVAIVNNAPWSIKPRVKILNEDEVEVDAPVSVEFIEPSTGTFHDPATASAYAHIESVWNNQNYYVNLQQCRIRDMEWDLRDTSKWEHFLPAEPPDMRIIEVDESVENLEEDEVDMVEKHLDIGMSWVSKIEISDEQYDQRYPNNYKAVFYKELLYERFSTHSQEDGTVTRWTRYSDNTYKKPIKIWSNYEDRIDNLIWSKVDLITGRLEEGFTKGRPDCLKYIIDYEGEKKKVEKIPKYLFFYSIPRLDSLRYLEILEHRLRVCFTRTPGSCYVQEINTKRLLLKAKQIKERYERDPSKPSYKDIAERQFLLSEFKLVVKFNYAPGALTAVTWVFQKPSTPEYGHEYIYDPEMAKLYKYGGSEPQPTELETYLLLLDMIKAEEQAVKSFNNRVEEIYGIFELRRKERAEPILRIRAFDSIRNGASRELRLAREKEEEEEKNRRWENPPDFLAPYLILYSGRKMTPKESWAAYNACLNDLKSQFLSLLNELQHRYEDLTEEAQSLKKFLTKFHDKFDSFDYGRLIQESKDLELNKRMVQKRLTITHEQAQKKYDFVKQSLLKDPRLNLKI